MRLNTGKEEDELNMSRPYTKKQWKEIWEASLKEIDEIFQTNSSMVEQSPDTTKAEGSSPSLSTKNIDVA